PNDVGSNHVATRQTNAPGRGDLVDQVFGREASENLLRADALALDFVFEDLAYLRFKEKTKF
ncbi:MAG: hypothetical protein ACR2NM_06405, partial [Bythopirellula sp.]